MVTTGLSPVSYTHLGYPNAVYEGVTVETMRTRNGEIMAENDIKNGKLPDVDYVLSLIHIWSILFKPQSLYYALAGFLSSGYLTIAAS